MRSLHYVIVINWVPRNYGSKQLILRERFVYIAIIPGQLIEKCYVLPCMHYTLMHVAIGALQQSLIGPLNPTPL